MTLKNKVALVLGSIKGIGKAVGLDLAGSGARVVYTHYDWPEALPELAKDAAAAGPEHLIVKADLREQDQVKALMSRTIDRFGRLDILVNNIERGGMPVVHGAYVQEQWDLEMATTLRAKQWAFSAALPHLKRSGDGVVINISSIAALVGRSGPASLLFNEGYAAANRGIAILTETWARLGAPQVRVNEIMLGIFDTRHAQDTRGWDLLDDDGKQAVIDHTLVGRTGRPDDVARAVSFLINDAPYMTGSVLRLDGGYVLASERIDPMPKGVV
ncbi:MAG: SDR family oxidoreductase [Desulfatitalea sp.]|nr:SDR family oxidoreductase [Desulfatitalea sp.]NNK02017.1 SDR family oxidoreductase [Desulfatitalea sp.]